MKISGSFFAFHIGVPLICTSVHVKLEMVIKKGGGTGPCEALATLDFEKVLHSTLLGRITKEYIPTVFFHIFLI